MKKYKVTITYEFEVEACHRADAFMEGVRRVDAEDLSNYADATVMVNRGEDVNE